MKKILSFCKTNPVFKTILFCISLLFPLLCYLFLTGVPVDPFHFVWVAFYSSLLVCLSFRSIWLKVLICGINLLTVSSFTFIALMGGTDIILAVIWNALVPFLPNPWY